MVRKGSGVRVPLWACQPGIYGGDAWHAPYGPIDVIRIRGYCEAVSVAASPIRSVQDPTCRFCDQLERGRDTSEAWSPVATSKRFVAVPSLGSLMPGWLLIVPTTHAINLSVLSPEDRTALDSFLRYLVPSWSRIFGPLLAFEHGPVHTGTKPGCGIDHAHLHLVPYEVKDLLAGARDMFPFLTWAPVRRLPSSADEPYLFIDGLNGHCWLASSPDIPSQALRRVIARDIGHFDAFDWKQFPRLEAVRETIEQVAQAGL